MSYRFHKVAIFTRKTSSLISETMNDLAHFLTDKTELCLVFEKTPKAQQLPDIDLAIVIGGDGSMINIAGLLAPFNIPVVGVNLGTLGFLTDIPINNMKHDIQRILEGHFIQEKRMLLSCEIKENDHVIESFTALNDIVIERGRTGHLLELEVHVDNQLMTKSRGDGLILSTPTGSTAYALAAGGPIVSPDLELINIVPICPHTLSFRPLTLHCKHKVQIIPQKAHKHESFVSIDGHIERLMTPNQIIFIEKSSTYVSLIHPEYYNYYDALRSKLGLRGDMTAS